MRISFDIDDTLVLPRANGRSESGLLPPSVLRWLCEPLRQGARSLINELQHRGWHIWIYTTSDRTPFQIRLWLFLHGVRVDGIINSVQHCRTLADFKFNQMPSKYPPAFGVDLHVDDSEGVRMEGEQHGFRTIIVSPEDENWAQRVFDGIALLKLKPGPAPKRPIN